MIPPDDAQDLRAAVAMLRAFRGWRQLEMANAADLAPSTLSRYESGTQELTREVFQKIAAATELPKPAIGKLLAWIREARPMVAADEDEPAEQSPGEVAMLDLAEAMGRLMGEVRSQAARPREGPAPGDRLDALEQWKRLEHLAVGELNFLVENAPEYQSWALCELLCDLSQEAASEDQTQRALELAGLAVHIAELAPGKREWRLRLQGYAKTHLASVRRATGDPSAAETFDRARILWKAGAAANPELLDEERVQALDAAIVG